MKVHVVAQITIAASGTEIFAYLANLKYHYLWNPQLQKISPLITLKQGVSYESMSMLLGVKISGKNKVTKFVQGKELELENSTGILQYRVNYRLQASHRKTVLYCTTSVSSSGTAFAFATPVLKLLARRELQSDLQALKIAVEQHLE